LVRDVEARLAHTGPDAREQLQAIGRAYVAFAVAHPETFAIMFRGELHERGNDELAKASDAAIELLGGTIRRGVAQGYVSPEAAPTAAAAAWSIAHGIADLWIQGRLQARTNERDSDKLATAVLGLFVSSIMPERVVPPAKRRR
jgi:AcrR family transcriptional regulator